MSWGATIKGVEGIAPEMQEALREGIRTGMEKLGIKGAEMVQENIRTPYGDLPPAVAFGNLAGSIISTQVSDPGKQGVTIGVGTQLGASAYAAPVETGARPHMPPASALVAWVQKKFQITDEKQALSVAFAVAKKISKRGTRGHDMFSRALAQLEPLAVPALESSIAQAFLRHGFLPLGGEA